MSDSLSVIEPFVWFAITVSGFCFVGFLAYRKNVTSAFVVLIATALSGGFLYLDHISEFAATATSLTIKVREASDALTGLRKVAALAGESLINLDAQSGTLGGDSASHRDQLKKNVLDLLRSIGVDDATMKQVARASRDRDIGDYVWGITSHVANCVLPQPAQAKWTAEVNQLWREDSPPKPDELQKLLDKYALHDDFTNKAIEEYRYFCLNDQHHDSEFWRDRDSWPLFDATANPNNKQKCRS